jgi:catechol 2,3-dioxygenase-like lactoylglutathione lyase family enzyme
MERIEESVAFWTEKAGFELTVSVPHGDALGFAILQNGAAELMLQSHASVAEDMPSLGEYARASKACLFVEVEDFDGMVQRLEGAPVAFPVRETPYGMKEIGVLEPGGHLAVFACRMG